jgi:hypothetical protein
MGCYPKIGLVIGTDFFGAVMQFIEPRGVFCTPSPVICQDDGTGRDSDTARLRSQIR